MIYLIILIGFILFSLLEQAKGTKTIVSAFKILSLIFIILFIGLRYRTGPDYYSYETIYYEKPVISSLEYLFRLFIIIGQKINLDYNYFLLFITFLSISIKWHIINKYSSYFFLSLVIASHSYIFSDMGQIRFSMAIATVWVGMAFCLERKLIPFLLTIFIASLMHRSALICLPIYWFYYINIKFWIMLGIWIGCYMLSFILEDMDFLGESIPFLSSSQDVVEKIDNYADNDEFGSRYTISPFAILSRIIVLVLVYFSAIPNERHKRLFTNTYFIGGCLFFLFSFNEIFGLRTSLYFSSLEVLMVPIAIYYIRDVKLHYFMMAFFIIKALYQLVVQIYIEYPEMYLPYQNVLFDKY